MTTQIQEYSATEAALADLRQRMSKAVYEVGTTKGMEAAKKDRAEVRGYRVALEKMRVDIKAPALERCKLIDAEAKRITEELSALEDPIDEQIKKEEQRKEAERLAKIKAEEDRIAKIRGMIAGLFSDVPTCCVSLSSAKLLLVQETCRLEMVDDRFMEFVGEAKAAKEACLLKLDELHAAAVAREQEAEKLKAEREELDRLRAADAKRVADEKAEADRLAKIERDRVAAERAESDRVAAVERQRLADERAAFDKQQADAKAEQDRLAAIESKRLADERAAFAKQQAEAKAESDRIAAEQKAEREAIERAKAPPPAPVPEFTPTAQQIVAVVAERFGVTEARAMEWLEALFSKEPA